MSRVTSSFLRAAHPSTIAQTKKNLEVIIVLVLGRLVNPVLPSLGKECNLGERWSLRRLSSIDCQEGDFSAAFEFELNDDLEKA